MEEKTVVYPKKDIYNIIRTTMRNNIHLTKIADNKAHVLLSLNAIMVTFIIPFFLHNGEIVKEYHFIYPLSLLIICCLATIYQSAMVLNPSKLQRISSQNSEGNQSPFFYGNYYWMSKVEYQQYLIDTLADPAQVFEHVSEDLYSIGVILAQKMNQIRKAFTIFLIGIISSVLITIILIILA